MPVTLWLPAAVGGSALLALAGVVWSSRRLRRRLAAREAELAVVHAASLEMLADPEPDRVAALMARECGKLLPADRVLLAVREGDGWRRVPGGAVEARPGGLLDRAHAGRREVRVEDGPVAFLDPASPEPGLRSALAVPLFVSERVAAVALLGASDPRAYGPPAGRLVATLGQQAVAALEIARQGQAGVTDPLTGLLLRDPFWRRLEGEAHRAGRYGGRFALLMLDLDGFKAINDAHGHLAGDRYLRELGPRLRGSLRSADLACRFGGDEFCILLPETDLAGAAAIAERVRDAVATLSVEIEGAVLRATASVGIAVWPDHERRDLPALLRLADQALYRAKRSGRDRSAAVIGAA